MTNSFLQHIGKLSKITVKNCSEDDVKCPFATGQNVSMELSFETSKSIRMGSNFGVEATKHTLISEIFPNFCINFNLAQDFEEPPKIRIAGILSSIPVPFKINPDTVCSYGAACPVKKGETNTIFLQFPIKSTYPKIQLKVQVQISAQTGESIVCVRFPAHIV